MNKKKLYIPPRAEVVWVCNGNICEGLHPVRLSYWSDGQGGGGTVGEGNGEGDAKEYGWDLWDEDQGFDEGHTLW